MLRQKNSPGLYSGLEWRLFSFRSTVGPDSRNPGGARTRVPPIPRRSSFFHIVCFFFVWVVLISVRLIWLQIVDHSEYVAQAARQQQRTFEVAPRRGMIFDRDLHPLAMTVLATSVYAVPIDIASKEDPQAREKYQAVARTLAKIVHTDPLDVYTSAPRIAARLEASRNFAWIARKLNEEDVDRIKALNIHGLYYQQEFKRYYPNNQLAAQILGYVGSDDNGLGGLESAYEQDLHGVPGRELAAIDARRHVLGSQEREPQPGKNLVLTIDDNIQYIAERALDAVMERTHALDATAVVQDPKTGEILALAIRPSFNPNKFRHATSHVRRDHAITDVYEPGSTFKLVTYSAALDQKLTNPNEVIDCQGGKINLAGRIIHDSHPNFLLTAAQALWESSDVAAVKLALRLGPDRFYQYIRAYGFGARSGIELPGETRGLLRAPRYWQASSIGSIAIGQEVAVTPIQLIAMVSTLANGGTYLPPRILREDTSQSPGHGLVPAAFHPFGELPGVLPEGAHRVVSTSTAAEMRRLLHGVVLNGTGKKAQLNGYSAGGKTGTAQKIDVRTHRYSKTDYVASFVGMAPVNDPVITVAVVVDSPRGGYYGASVAAPAFQEIAQNVLEYLGVPHDEPIRPVTPALNEAKLSTPPPPEPAGDLDALFAAANDLPADDPLRAEMAGASGSTGERGTDAQTSAIPPSSAPQEKGTVIVDARGGVAVPSMIGQPLRQAIESAGRAGLRLDIVGSGIAREQVPAAGASVPPGTRIVVRFSR